MKVNMSQPCSLVLLACHLGNPNLDLSSRLQLLVATECRDKMLDLWGGKGTSILLLNNLYQPTSKVL